MDSLLLGMLMPDKTDIRNSAISFVYTPRVMLRRLLSAAALLLLLASRAQAAPIELLFTVNHYTPIVGPPEIGLQFTFFESATNGWPGSFPPQPFLANGGAVLLPGVTQFSVSLDAVSLENIYFTAYGGYWSGPGFQFQSIYVAEPPTGPVPDALAYGYGPPWISLANLGDGLSGEFRYIYGYSNGPIGTWEVTSVPEPTSVLLLGSGLAAVLASRYRQSKAVQ